MTELMTEAAEEADDDISTRIAAENRRQRSYDLLVARGFTEACRIGRVRDFYRSVACMEATVEGWRLAMKGVGRLPSAPPRIQRAFLPVWIEHKNLPRAVGHRPTMAAALRVLMAGRYRGKALTLFRGTIESELRRRAVSSVSRGRPIRRQR
jgi:hypothetical protein